MPTGVYQRVKPMSEEAKRKIGDARRCKPLSAEHRAKLAAAKLGKPGPWSGKKRGPMPEEWRRNIAASSPKGRDSHRWGVPPKRNKWVRYGDINFRSGWEARFAESLDRRGIRWEYEPTTFDLGHRTYTPDFYTPEIGVYWEVKGWLNDDAQDKIFAFRSVFSEIPLVVVTRPVLEMMEV